MSLPIVRTLDLVFRLFPAMNRIITRRWYRYLTRSDKSAQMIFMNYGYADLNHAGSKLFLHKEDEGHRYSIQLYHYVASAVDLKGCDVLEIGCGRGGGASYIARYLSPKSMTGIDIVNETIEFCKKHYNIPGLVFSRGNAESLPFPDNSFDVLVNVESSGHYDSMKRFLSEVYRTLRPKGYFLLADIRDRKDVNSLRKLLKRSGFAIIGEERITPNVLQSLDLDSERKIALIHKGVPRLIQAVLKDFAATRGTSRCEAFRKGDLEYMGFILRKKDKTRMGENI
jgi:ubiquinone/menaquinone biosynthesis C-methylase UbiE